MRNPFKWFLSIIVVAVGILFIVASPLSEIISGTAGFWVEIIFGIILILAAISLRPK